MTLKHLTDQRFIDLNLLDPLKQGITDAGFEFCTPIQEKSLPVALTGKDVAGQAQTGTGKTVAFLLACCQHLLTNPSSPEKHLTGVRALILAPTRELAIQIFNDAEVLAKHTDLKLGLVYGGTGYDDQKKMLSKGADILIGTPGRLIDFYKQKLFDLKFTQVVVLDEADRMFDLGFIKDIRFLLRRMPQPESRLNMLFSATLSFRVMELAYEHMNNPQEIKIDSDSRVANKIEEFSYYPADEEKATLLINLLRRDNPERVLVFVNTRHGVEEVSRILSANGISNAALSGDVPQRKRENLLKGFKTGKYRVMVATDVAARGLHIPEVNQVYNYDLPQDADDYVHRIGRTARAGHSGEAISFICERYAYSILEIETYIGHAIPKKEIDPELLNPIETIKRLRKDKRPHKKSSSKKPSNKKPSETKTGITNLIEKNSDVDEVANNQASTQSATSIPSPVAETNFANPQIEKTGEGEISVAEKLENADQKQPSSPPPQNKIQHDKLESTASEPQSGDHENASEIPQPITPTKDSGVDVEVEVDIQKTQPVKIATAVNIPKTRFSRRFGEVPVVG